MQGGLFLMTVNDCMVFFANQSIPKIMSKSCKSNTIKFAKKILPLIIVEQSWHILFAIIPAIGDSTKSFS
jgi:hypothetical protein